VVEAAHDSVRPAIEAKRLQVEVTIPNGLEPLRADPDRIQQVVWNTLSNAVKFTPVEGRITFIAQRSDAMIELSVADNGADISAAFLPRVFDRFSQQNARIAREHGGMGLGLAIVRHIARIAWRQCPRRQRRRGGRQVPCSASRRRARERLVVATGDPSTTCRTERNSEA
jgi:signal transduction histidine kinase